MLHTYAAALPDAMGLAGADVVMPVVPMFHVNAWALPYGCAMVGAKLVFPGPKMGDPETLQALIESEQVTFAAGVPTVWQGLIAYLEKTGKRIDSLKRVLSGGSAVPVALMNQLRERGVEVVHAWGMTEMSPIGTIRCLSPEAAQLPAAERDALRAKQGRTVFGIELKITDEDGKELPRDGKAFGALKVRGPWIASSYYQRDNDAVFEADGWFNTGDVATICPLGYMQITDRTKDVIKSGGEWISSIELENLAVAHPAVAQAAAIAIPHPKWQERPLLVVVLKAGASATREELLEFYLGKVAKWWIPDDVVFVDKLPLTATGKLSKLQLRQQFADYKFASDCGVGRASARQHQPDREDPPHHVQHDRARHEHLEAPHDLVAGEMNVRVRRAQHDVAPRTRQQEQRRQLGDREKGAQRVEQHRHFEQVAEVIGGLHVLQRRRPSASTSRPAADGCGACAARRDDPSPTAARRSR